MNYLDLFGDSSGIEVPFATPNFLALNGVCEDDCEYTAVLMTAMPDESPHEEGSPLNFREPWPVTAGELTEANKQGREQHRENLRQRQQRQIRKAAKEAKREAAKLAAMTVIA